MSLVSLPSCEDYPQVLLPSGPASLRAYDALAIARFGLLPSGPLPRTSTTLNFDLYMGPLVLNPVIPGLVYPVRAGLGSYYPRVPPIAASVVLTCRRFPNSAPFDSGASCNRCYLVLRFCNPVALS